MAIKAIIAKLEDANENVRSLYRAGTAEEGAEGKFVLDVEAADGFNLENVSGLKTALSAERSTTGQLRGQLKAFEGLDPEKARAAIAKVEELGTLDPKKDVDRLVEEKVQAQLGQITERHNGELETERKAREKREALLRTTLVKDAALNAIIAEKGDPDLLLPHVLPAIKLDLEEQDDKLVPKIRILDAAGNVRIGDSAGGNMTIEQLVGEMKKHEKFSRLFEGSGHQGTGAEQDRKPKGSDVTGKKLSQLSRKEKSNLINEIGLQEFQQRVAAESRESADA